MSQTTRLKAFLSIFVLISPAAWAINQPPTAKNLEKTIKEDQSVIIALAGKDPERKKLSYSIARAPEHGSITIKGNKAKYTPNPDYFGTDTFQYTSYDGQLNSAQATISLIIRPVNDAPIATPQTLDIASNVASTFLLSGTDVENAPITYQIVTKPKKGRAMLSEHSITYLPNNPGFQGQDSFTFKVHDGHKFSKPAKINLTLKLKADNPSNVINLSHIESYEVPYAYRDGNVMLDQNNLILAGGELGNIGGGTYDGHPAFSNQIYTIDLGTGAQSNYTIAAQSGHQYGEGVISDGIGQGTIIRKLADGKYFVYGGFQYAINSFLVDMNESSVQTYPVNIQITDNTGLNTTPFNVNNQASALLSNGNMAFFGFNNGLYAMDNIIVFDVNLLDFQPTNTALTMPRSNVDAYKLEDGRVLLVGGWDGTATVTPNSATRRAEIYDPTSETIERIADFPEPKHSGQHRSGIDITSADAVCVDNYKLLLADKTWVTGCDLPGKKSTPLFNLPEGYQGQFVGYATNGNVVMIEQNYQTLGYDDQCSCYPFENPTKIHVFSKD